MLRWFVVYCRMYELAGEIGEPTYIDSVKKIFSQNHFFFRHLLEAIPFLFK